MYLFWLCWAFIAVCGLSLVVVSGGRGGYSQRLCTGLSFVWPLVAGRGLSAHGLQQLYPAGSIVVAHELSSSMACGIFVHWQANS